MQLCKESWHGQVNGLSDTGKVKVGVWLARVKLYLEEGVARPWLISLL